MQKKTYPNPTLTLSEAHNAVAQHGGKPSRIAKGRFSFSNVLCHGGNSPAGSWAGEKDGRITFHCVHCPFPGSDRQIRMAIGLPPWEPPGNDENKPGYLEREVRRWEYHNPTTGETMNAGIRYYPDSVPCPTGQHPVGRRCKHAFTERKAEFERKPIDGFLLHHHRPLDTEAATTRPAVIVEGQDTADKVAEVGFDAYSYLNGCKNAAKADYSPLAGRDALIHPDNDFPGAKAALEAAIAALDAGAKTVRVLPPVTFKPGADLADVGAELREELLSAAGQPIHSREHAGYLLAIQAVEVETARIDGHSPRAGLLDVNPNHHFDEHSGQAWAFIQERNRRSQAKGNPPFMYQYNELPCKVEPDVSGGFKPLLLDDADNMYAPAAESIFWHKGWASDVVWSGWEPFTDPGISNARRQAVERVTPKELGYFADAIDKDGAPALEYRYPSPHYPNRSLVRAMSKRPSPALPLLKSIVSYPVLHNGQLLTRDGYHADSGLYLDLGGVEIDATLTPAQGVAIWRDLTIDFCFAGDADFAGLLAYALTPLVHNAVELAPAALFNKTQPRTGATLLSQIVSIVIIGKDPCFITYTPDEADLEKKFCSALLAGNILCRMDNVAIPVNSALFHSLLTAPVVQFRLLGQNRYIDIDVRNVSWCLTGNSIQIGKEMLERSHLINLDAQTPEPGNRSGPTTGPRKGEAGWKHPQVVKFARDNRSRLLSALCAILQGWIDAGRPAPTEPPPLGGFESWINTIGGALEHAGVAGFMQNRQLFAINTDGEGQDIANFVEVWWEKWNNRRMKAGELRELAFGLDEGAEELIDPDSIPTRRGGVPSPKGFAIWLDKRIVGQYFSTGSLTLSVVKTAIKPQPFYQLQPLGGKFFDAGPDSVSGESVGDPSIGSVGSVGTPGPEKKYSEVPNATNATNASADTPPPSPVIGDPCRAGCGRGLTNQDAWATGFCRFCRVTCRACGKPFLVSAARETVCLDCRQE